MNEVGIVYLAVPYSHPDSDVMQLRFEAANRAAGKLMMQGEIVFSPITHGHPISLAAKLPADWNYWRKHCLTFMAISKKMVVLMLPGWAESIGVNAEIKLAYELGLLVEFIEP